MKSLALDIETFSDIDLQKCGVYRYAESPQFEIMLLSYAENDGEVVTIDLASGDPMPPEIIDALLDDDVQKWAHNAQFERVCLSQWLRRNVYLDPASWRCSMVWAATLGLPLSLAQVGAVLKLDEQKMSEGKSLIAYFSKPCAPTKSNGMRTRNLPQHDPEKWEMYKSYNRRDVEVELAITRKLAKFPPPEWLWDEYRLDQEINDRGVLIDLPLVRNAIIADERAKSALAERMKQLAQVENPKSVTQLKKWLRENGVQVESLGKKAVAELIKDVPLKLAAGLELRLELAKSSTSKYAAMERCACADGRVRGMFQFYGAGRTGRWSGKLVQLQNVVANHMPDLAEARALVRSGNFEMLEALYDRIPTVLSELIRTAIIAPEGMKLAVGDFASIEAVVLAWLSGQDWVLEAYAARRDLYIENAYKMFGAEPGSVDKKSPLRQKSKVAVLACGFGGSVGAFRAMGGAALGLSDEEMLAAVHAWRAANPRTVEFWRDCETAAKTTIRTGEAQRVRCLTFEYRSGMLFIALPSGRKLAYARPEIGVNKFGGDAITYMGLSQSKKWTKIETFGGKLAENATQAIARDLLAHAMRTLRHCAIVMSVHDELVIEADPRMSVDVLCEQMSRVPDWAAGLPLRAAGYETKFYLKD